MNVEQNGRILLTGLTIFDQIAPGRVAIPYVKSLIQKFSEDDLTNDYIYYRYIYVNKYITEKHYIMYSHEEIESDIQLKDLFKDYCIYVVNVNNYHTINDFKCLNYSIELGLIKIFYDIDEVKLKEFMKDNNFPRTI